MIFKEYGDSQLPTIILLHGGGLSDWSLKKIVESFKEKYHIVIPIIDGHGQSGEETFISIENSSKKLLDYIDTYLNGRVFALGGLSIGAQIVIETLCNRLDIAENIIIESGLIYPIKGTKILIAPMISMSYGLIKYRWFSKIQSKSLFVSDELFEQYYNDSLRMSKESLTNMIISNGTYKLKNSTLNTSAKVLIIVGEKEPSIMKKSAFELNRIISNSKLYIAPKMGHGEISVKYHTKYVELLMELFKSENMTV